MEDESSSRRLTAYHEAGHAIAITLCPDGSIEFIDICDRDANDDENGTTSGYVRDADEAFRIYAGPWVEARLHNPGGAVTPESALDRLRANRDDWIAFQHIVGNPVGISEFTQMQESLLGLGHSDDSMPPEYCPPLEWHKKADRVLAEAWHRGEIQALAEQMLGRAKTIELTNGQVLTRDDSRDRWYGSNYVAVPGEGEGLVGPPPPNAASGWTADR